MILYAAIDLRGGQAVQLVGGRPEAQKVALPEPIAIAQKWIDAGIAALHVVDLDAALGDGDNRVIIGEILDMSTVPVQVGGGVRDEEAIDSLLAAGAARVIVGTRAIEDPSWRLRMTERFHDRLVVAADVREKRVVTRGWRNDTAIGIHALLEELAGEPLASVLITDVGREGQMIGIDVALFQEIVITSVHPVIAAGGIRDMNDLHALETAGLSGAVLGMSLYTGAIDPMVAAAEFS
jgi:phosphoribosylformimino-5-aminoimidazole carboxamide ribotide isomerase